MIVAAKYRVTAIVLTLVFLLAGCSGGIQPFGKEEPAAELAGKTAPPIVLAQLTGLPREQVQTMREALSAAAGQKDIAILDSETSPGNLSLSGQLTAAAADGQTKVSHAWTLSDATGAVIHTYAGEESAVGFAGGDPWAQVTPALLQRIASATAASLSTKLSQMGYATQTGWITRPPAETYVAAGPGAERDIDYETVEGPQEKEPAIAVADLESPEAQPQEVAAPATEEPAEPAKKNPKGAVEIKAVAVVPVKGAKGKGNEQLTAAMRKTLADAGWPVLKAPRADALTIAGTVESSAGESGNENVSVKWAVKTKAGKLLGSVDQSNQVPAGSLDAGFGENAGYVAEAAASGIFDLIKKFR